MKTIPTIPLQQFEYRKEFKRLSIPSEGYGMPAEFFVKSHHTGRVVRFVPVPPWHDAFDQDQWDGEQQIYMPAPGEDKTNVETAVIYHAW